ncbi:hypothetical protein BDZ91DRAFT_128081 [Kalaharituber pfeilii]|nr:hypothetical protein BDZ91DRAFT_128081 [Kalaharituber pfeilii]
MRNRPMTLSLRARKTMRRIWRYTVGNLRTQKFHRPRGFMRNLDLQDFHRRFLLRLPAALDPALTLGLPLSVLQALFRLAIYITIRRQKAQWLHIGSLLKSGAVGDAVEGLRNHRSFMGAVISWTNSTVCCCLKAIYGGSHATFLIMLTFQFKNTEYYTLILYKSYNKRKDSIVYGIVRPGVFYVYFQGSS